MKFERYHWNKSFLVITHEIVCKPFIYVHGNKTLLAIKVWGVIAPLVWSMCYNNYILINIAKHGASI